MKTFTPEQLKKLTEAMASHQGPTGHTETKKNKYGEEITYFEMKKCPWSALEPFFPEGWTKDEVRKALFDELVTKPFAEEVTRRAGEMKSRLRNILVSSNNSEGNANAR